MNSSRDRHGGGNCPAALSGMPKRKPKPKPAEFRRTPIREWRQHAGMSLEELAEKIGVVPSALSMLERGQRGYTQERLEAIAREFRVSVSRMLAGPPVPGEDEDWLTALIDATPEQIQQFRDISRLVRRH